MTNATDALTDKIEIEPASDAEAEASGGGPVVLPDHAAEAWAGVLIDIHEKRERMAAEASASTERESPSHVQ